jgi:antitoxin PrlF
MATAKMTTKGQVTVPKPVRDRLGLRPGDEIEFVEEGGVVRLKKRFRRRALTAWRGYLKGGIEGMTVDALVAAMRGESPNDSE